MVSAQIEAVLGDVGADAVKTGMLYSPEIIETVADLLGEFAISKLVVDPVMASTGGDSLIATNAVQALKDRLFPLATLITPNLHEAEVLTGRVLSNQADIEEAARELHSFGPRAVIITGGHLRHVKNSNDLIFTDSGFSILEGPRIPTRNTHGSGCTFASAIAAYLAHGNGLGTSASRAKSYVTEAIRHSFPLGKGNGPLGHFFRRSFD
jgi:hydroxymethylpyrimidine/phosphomethylpyrimidine kinase